MSFSYEKVGEENLNLFKGICFRDWNEKPIACIPNGEWCIDKLNNVYFVSIGSFRGETPHYADLSYKGRIVRMETSRFISDSGIMEYAIKRILIPNSIWEYKEDILQKIIEASETYFCGKSIGNDMKVEITIENEAECVEADYNGR
jgi:hypothetical protein